MSFLGGPGAYDLGAETTLGQKTKRKNVFRATHIWYCMLFFSGNCPWTSQSMLMSKSRWFRLFGASSKVPVIRSPSYDGQKKKSRQLLHPRSDKVP